MDLKKLLNLVQKHPCLYKSTNKDYTNNLKKNKIWNKIGKEFNVTGYAAKMKWKNMRDYYIKRCKDNKQRNTDKPWAWHEHMQFLNESLQCHQAAAAVVQGSDDLGTSPDSRRLTPSPYRRSPSPLQSFPGSSAASLYYEELRISSSSLTAGPSSEVTVEHPPRFTDLDATDLLFLSYARTFRALSVQSQMSIKLKLAALFAEAEFKESNETSASAGEVEKHHLNKVVVKNEYVLSDS